MRGIAIVEDHRLLAETLCQTMRAHGHHAESITLCEPVDLLAALLERRPLLVLLDLDLGAFGDSTWLIEPLTADGIKVLVLTGTGDRMRIASALEQGAVGYQLKDAAFDTLIDRAELAIATDGLIDPVEYAQLCDELAQTRIEQARRLEPFSRLTDREKETLRALVRGRSVHEIARDWVLAEATVRTHVRSVLAKLNVSSQLAAVSLALRSGWIDPSSDTSRTARECGPAPRTDLLTVEPR